jgi:SNF2 family DNA or RNA helicase
VPHTLELGAVYGTPVFTLQCFESAVKNVYGASFSGRDKLWRFPAFFPVHSVVLADLSKVVPGLQYAPEVVEHVKKLAQPPALPDDFSFLTEPYQHQRDGVLHLKQHPRAALFYSPGLGKCKITVDLQRLTQDRMLILCPLVMLGTWAEEFKKHGNVDDVIIIDGSKKQKLERIAQAQTRAPVATVLTYNVATLYTDDIIKIDYTAMIVDESHMLKTPFSKRTVAATTLAARAARRVLLSGTPSLGSPFDLYAQLRFLGTYFCPENWWAFRKMFGVFPDHEKDEAVPKMLLGFKNLDTMNKRVSLVCLKKTKEECLDLPDQVILDEHFVVTNATKRAYNTLILDACLGAGLSIREQQLNGELSIDTGTTLSPHVIADETIAKLNKLDQLASSFVYMGTKNPGLCNGCVHVQHCSDHNVAPYTTACRVVTKEPESVVELYKDNARIERCIGLLESILEDPDNKVIIWAKYMPELDILENTVKELSIGYVRVQGGFTREQLTAAMQKFNTDKTCRVYIGQVATGVGVTLNAANYMIYYNLPWSLDHYLQSLDRNYRIGQTKKVTVYRLIGRHTLDVSKAAALDQKVDFSQLVTAKTMCATCSDYHGRCTKYKIKLYDDECKYDRTMMRKTATVELIP